MRNGYQFLAPFQSALSPCEFIGLYWAAPPKSSCAVFGFYSNKSKCKSLREGWKIKSIELSGPFSWATRPINTAKPFFDIRIVNEGTVQKNVRLRQIDLIGPVGPANHWQEAFSHCSK